MTKEIAPLAHTEVIGNKERTNQAKDGRMTLEERAQGIAAAFAVQGMAMAMGERSDKTGEAEAVRQVKDAVATLADVLQEAVERHDRLIAEGGIVSAYPDLLDRARAALRAVGRLP